MRVAAVVLAAGASRRLGEPKQLVRIGGRNLLERAVEVARAAGCAPIYVVLGAGAAEVREGCNLGDARVIENVDWEEGMASSVRAGVAAAAAMADGLILLTCDQPAVTADHLRVLRERGAAGEVVASSYAGRRGVPAYFPGTRFGELLALRGDTGAREMLQAAECVALLQGELDVDTAAALKVARQIFG